MSEYVVFTGVNGFDPSNLSLSLLSGGLRRYLQMPGSELTESRHVVGRSVLVTLATGLPPDTEMHALQSFRRGSGAEIVFTNDRVVIETPLVTNRTLWRFRNHELDLVSTSLQALSYLIGDVELDESAAHWMLLSGTLGPEVSWDRRIRQMSPATRYVLGTGETVPRHKADNGSLLRRSVDWERELEQRLGAVIDGLDLRPADWGLPLSGGVDSRGLALALGGSLPAFTWGAESSRADPLSDLSVACRVAAKLQLDHCSLDLTAGRTPAGAVLDRFVAASECRTENIAGYVDGMQLWQDLRALGIRGIVRGDEVFGWVRRTAPPASRVSTGAVFAGDLLVPQRLKSAFEAIASQQTIPSWIVQDSGESLPDYRDRLYRRFRCSSLLAALTQTKSGYVDVTNPFLADPVVELVSQMPAKLRTDKKMFKRYVTARSHGIPFAERSSERPSSDFLRDLETSRVLRDQLSALPSPVGVEPEILEFVMENRDVAGSGSGGSERGRRVIATVRRTVPHTLRRELAIRQLSQPQRVDASQLLFRTFLVAAGQQLLVSAAAAGRVAMPHPQ